LQVTWTVFAVCKCSVAVYHMASSSCIASFDAAFGPISRRIT